MVRNLGRGLALLGLILLQVPLFAMTVLAMLLSLALGLVFLFPPQVRLVRRMAELHRRLAGDWGGVEISSPYHPRPPPPKPGADGLYRHHRTLYKTPRMPAWNDRWKWLFGDPATWRDIIWLLLDPLAKVVFAVPLVLTPGRTLPYYAHWANLLLAPTAASRLAGQVQRLNQVRHQTVDSQAAELRRIERDLHDGTQARLVALGLTLGAAEALVETDPDQAKAVMAKARQASHEALAELRRVVRGIHPPVLAERGLGDAVRAMALDSPLRVDVNVDLPHRPEAPVEAAAYFAVSELLQNATRHGGAERVMVDISHIGADLRVTVSDDGSGGADPAKGSGLRGLEQRLAAFDGLLALNSPPGGPTTVSMHVPRVLPIPAWDIDTAKMPRWKTTVVVLGWSLGWLPLFPQGLVTAVFKIFDLPNTWFLALALPEPWQWPTIIFLICLGVTMYGLSIFLPIQHSRERWLAEAGPHHLWLNKC